MGYKKGKSKSLTEREQKIIKKISGRLKINRIKRGYTSYENFAFDSEIARMSVFRLEKGESDFNFTSLLKVLDKLEVSLEDFFKGIK